MEQYIIKGGNPLVGEVEIGGAKNAALAILAAAIMTDETVLIDNLPDVNDINVLLEAIQGIGAMVQRVDRHTVKINGSAITDFNIEYDYIKKIRASYYLLGAMLGKYKRAEVALPGGCNIGSRPIDQHLKGFRALGADVDIEHGKIVAEAEHLRGTHLYFDVVSVGATINVMMAAAMADGLTIMENVAKEPHVVDVANFLNSMNKNIFKNPEELMENILGVTSFLRKKIIENGGDPERETLNVIPTKDGNSYFVDSEGEYWRCYNFIEGATSYDQVESEEDFYQSAVSFGNFQRLLADYPAETLHETIKGFHDTKARFETFKKAVNEDICGRAHSVQDEIQFVLAHEDLANAFGDMLENKELPLRVTHNDTKLNNIMIDNETHKGICVIDLDTVMPGLAMNDFGDSIRFGASTGAEDETDLDKIQCDMNLFDIYAKGFIEGCAGKLTTKEIELLPLGAKVMTFECGMRFLTDYLQGDTYFKIHRENHNLDRCRTQFKLVSDMEAKWDTMNAIIQKYKKTH